MVQTELISRSPLRILERSTHGGVGKGNIGVIAGTKGSGATACLVHIATDQLFQNRHVVHISFLESTQHIISWYEDIFSEISKRYKLDNAMTVHDEIVKNSVVINFAQSGVHAAEMEKSLAALVEKAHFNAEVVVIDNYDFTISSVEELAELKGFAEKFGLELWFSACISDNDGVGVPKELEKLAEEMCVIIRLKQTKDHVHLKLVKDHDSVPSDLHLALDPVVLLIAEE